jgi:hypothetical protein
MDIRDYHRICEVLQSEQLVTTIVYPRPKETENLPFVEIYLGASNSREPARRSAAVAVNALATAGLVRVHDRGQGAYEVAGASPGYILLADSRWQPAPPTALSS